MSCPGHSCFHQLLAPSRRCVLPAAPARAVCLLQAPGSGRYQRVRRAALCSALSLHCFCLPPRCPLGVWWCILFYFAKWSPLLPFASAKNVVAAIAIEMCAWSGVLTNTHCSGELHWILSSQGHRNCPCAVHTSSGHTVSLSRGNRVSLCSKTRENAKMKMVWMSWDLQLSSLDTTMGIQAPNRLQHLEAAPWCGIETSQCHKELSSCVSVSLRRYDPQNLPAYSCVPYCSEMSPWEVSVFSSKVDQGFSTYLFSPVLWSQALLVF